MEGPNALVQAANDARKQPKPPGTAIRVPQIVRDYSVVFASFYALNDAVGLFLWRPGYQLISAYSPHPPSALQSRTMRRAPVDSSSSCAGVLALRAISGNADVQ